MFAHSMRAVSLVGQELSIPSVPCAAWLPVSVEALLSLSSCAAFRRTRISTPFLVVALLSGCASFSGDQGMDAISSITKSSLNAEVAALSSDDDFDAANRTVAAMLKRPLRADAAVQIALLNNRELQAAYNELGIAEAARVRASLPANPRFSVSRIAGSGAFEFESPNCCQHSIAGNAPGAG